MPSLTYIDCLTEALSARGKETIFKYQDAQIAADSFLCSIYRYARALKDFGVTPNDVVAQFAPNAPDAIAIRYAINLLGAGACYLPAPTSEAARIELIKKIAPDFLVVFPETAKLLPRAIGVATIQAGDCGLAAPRLDHFAASQSSQPMPSAARPDQLAVIVSSGGSTGTPKGSCRNFATYTRLANTGLRPERRQLVNGRLAYLSEIFVDQTLVGGGFVVLRDHFDASDTLTQIETNRITDLFLVEPQLFELMDHPRLASTDISSLQTLTHIGASAPPSLRLQARTNLGPILAHSYGASEEGLVSLLSPQEYDPAQPERLSSAGRVLPGVEIRLRTADGGISPKNIPGVIEVRSPTMAQGYRNQPDLTAKAFRDGWYHSGDLGVFDEQGYLHIFGRAEDIEATQSGIVAPSAIEDVLCGGATVQYAVVVMDRLRGTRIAAIKLWGREFSQKECMQAVSEKFGADIARTLTFAICSKIPLTEQGKPDRNAILELGEHAQAREKGGL